MADLVIGIAYLDFPDLRPILGTHLPRPTSLAAYIEHVFLADTASGGVLAAPF